MAGPGTIPPTLTAVIHITRIRARTTAAGTEASTRTTEAGTRTTEAGPTEAGPTEAGPTEAGTHTTELDTTEAGTRTTGAGTEANITPLASRTLAPATSCACSAWCAAMT